MLSNTRFREFYATFVVYIGFVVAGMDGNFSAYLVAGTEGYTIEDESLIGSTNMIFRAFGSIIGSLIVDRFGRINTLQVALGTSAIAWFTIATSPSTKVLLIGRALSGIAIALQTAGVIYIAEVSHPNRRGKLVAMRLLATALGMFLFSSVTYFCHWRTTSFIAVAISVFGVIPLYFIPESKYWYLLRGNRMSAVQSILWFSVNKSSVEVMSELQNIQKTIPEADANKSGLCSVLRRRSELKAFLVCVSLVICLGLSGRLAVFAHLEHFFKTIQSDFDNKKLVVGLSFFEVIGSILYVTLVDRFNRRLMLYITTTVMSCCMIGILAHNLELVRFGICLPWIIVLLFCMYMILNIVGLMSGILIIMTEILHREHRGALINLVSAVHLLIAAGHADMMPYILKYVDINIVFMYFWISIMLITLVVMTAVPENRGKELYECAETRRSKKIQKKLTAKAEGKVQTST